MLEIKEIEVSPLDRQKILRKLAIAFSSTEANRFFSMIQALDDVIGCFGNRDILEEVYKEKKDIVKKILRRYRKYVSVAEAYYIGLDEQTIDKKDINSARYKEFEMSMKNIYRNYFYISKILCSLLKYTSLKNQTIPSKYWQQVNYKEKKLYKEEEKRRDYTNYGREIEAEDYHVG